MSGTRKLKGILKTLINELLEDRGYKTMLKKFHQVAESKDRTKDGLTMFLVFDIDTLEFKMETEHTATHNQIVMAVARIPPKGSKDAGIYYQGAVYTWMK